MSYAVRPITALDLAAILRLATASQEAPQWNRAAYENILIAGAVQHFAYLAHDLDALQGFAIASWLSPEEPAELETVVVDTRFRRQGIGATLLRACMQAATQAGATTIRLEVRESNLAALSLYQHHGFSLTGRRRVYYSSPVEDAILLQAHLGSSGKQSPL